MANLTYAMCLRSKLVDVQKNGLDKNTTLYSTQEAAEKTLFTVDCADSLEQGVLLYIDMEWLEYQISEIGIVKLMGHSTSASIAHWRIGVIRVAGMKYRSVRGPRGPYKPRDKSKNIKSSAFTKEQRRRNISEGMKKAVKKRKEMSLIADLVIPTL